jgi:glycosyltransferase involved in cell wall biosynthesis
MVIYEIRLLFLLLNLLKKNNYNIFQVRDDPIAGVIVLIIRLKNDILFIYNHSFPFYQESIISYNNGFTSIFNLIYNKLINILLNHIVLKYANFILPISKEMLCELKKQGIKKDKMYPLPLGIEPKIFKVNYQKKKKFEKKLSLNKNDFVFIYIGEISKMRNLNEIIFAFNIIKNKNLNSKLLFVGDGDAIEELKNICQKLRLTDYVKFTGRVPYWDVPSYVDLATICLSLFHPRACYNVSSPCKIFEYMAVQKPIIANNEIPEHRRVLTSCNCGILTEYNIQAIADSMIKMKTFSLLKLKKMGIDGYNWLMENKTFEKMAYKMEKIYLDLLKER